MAKKVGYCCLICPQRRWNLFWELFAGEAILSRTFENEGWRTGPPIDIVYTQAFNLLDPGFFMVVLGLILEGWVSVLHLGPPCSSVSMAFNGFASQQIKNSERPAGLDNLTEAQVTKVRLGNELVGPGGRHFGVGPHESRKVVPAGATGVLADVASAFVQGVTHGPSSLQGGEVRVRRRSAVEKACCDHLNGGCPGCASHISLHGKSPDGRSWTAVASPHWPACRPSDGEMLGVGTGPDRIIVERSPSWISDCRGQGLH